MTISILDHQAVSGCYLFPQTRSVGNPSTFFAVRRRRETAPKAKLMAPIPANVRLVGSRTTLETIGEVVKR